MVCITCKASALPLRPSGNEPPLPEIQSIPLNPKAFLEKDYRAEERAWAQRLLLKPAQETWKDQPWAKEATELLESALELRATEAANAQPLAPLAQQFRELVKKAPGDNLISVFAAEAIFSATQDRWEVTPLLEQVLTRGDLPGVIEAMAVRVRLEVAKLEGSETQQLETRYLEALIRSLADGSYDEAGHTVLLRHHLDGLEITDFSTPEVLERWSSNIEESALPDWLKLTLRGAGQKDLAWVKRSSATADNVNNSQWQGFADHLKVARDLLGQAARLRPDRPEAAAIMIPVAMGENVDPSELRSWFDRSVSAQLDYHPAYKGLLWSYRPRWGGSHELMLAFGKACAATGRHDTAVPSYLMVAALDVSGEVYEAHKVFRHPHVKREIAEMSRGYLEAAPAAAPQTRLMRQSNAAMCAWLADDDQVAKKALDAAGPQLHRNTRLLLNDLLMHESMLRAEVAADIGEYGEAIQKAANPEPGTPLKDIHEAMMKVDEKGLSPDALAYLKEVRELTGLQEKIKAGGWVPLSFNKHLTGYFQTEYGEWSVEPDGTLVAHGTDQLRPRLLLRIPMGPNIEMKGEISFDIPEAVSAHPGSIGLGPVVHWLPTCTSGVRAMMFYLSKTSACTKAWCASMRNSTSDIHFPAKEWNTFNVRTADGFLSYDINERNMTRKHSMEDLGLETESGLIGFGSYCLPIGAKARIRNVSIRQITSDELLPAKAAKASPLAMVAQNNAAPAAKSYKLYWQLSILGVLALLAVLIPRFMASKE